MKRHFLRRALAIEDIANGVAVTEIEHVYYARLEGTKELYERAIAREYQEQWEIRIPKTERNATAGTMRVRHSQMPDEQARFTMTTKIKIGGGSDRTEVSISSMQGQFEQFARLADKGMKKVRFYIPVANPNNLSLNDLRGNGGLIWEIDMFLQDPVLTAEECLQEGVNFHEWCKIDLEVTDRNAPVPEFPLNVVQIITSQDGQRTADEEQTVRKLYDTAFTVANRYA